MINYGFMFEVIIRASDPEAALAEAQRLVRNFKLEDDVADAAISDGPDELVGDEDDDE